MPDISRLAVVEAGAKLADDVRIGPFCYIGPHVRIDRGCVIDNNATITGRTTLGERNRVYPLAVIGTPGDAGEGEVVLGKANVIREHVTIHGGQDRTTRLGTDNLVMIACQIGAGAQIGDHGIFVNSTQIGAGAKIEDYVRTSAFISIDPGVTVGAYTFTLGYAQIDQDAPPFAMVQGSPFRVRGVNSENLKRCGFGQEDIRRLKAAFRDLFDGDQATGAAALEALANDPSAGPHVQRLVRSIRGSSGSPGT